MTATPTPPSTINEAIARFKSIPAVRALWHDDDLAFINEQLDLTKGTIPNGATAYRVFYVAWLYLKQHPAIHRVTEHRGTKLGSYTDPIEAMLSLQASQDALAKINVSPGFEAQSGGNGISGKRTPTVAVRRVVT